MKIEVTQFDIDRGIWRNETHCPIALATNRAFSHTGVAKAGYLLLAVEFSNGKRILWDMPRAAQDFIDAFDARRPVAPFTFEI